MRTEHRRISGTLATWPSPLLKRPSTTIAISSLATHPRRALAPAASGTITIRTDRPESPQNLGRKSFKGMCTRRRQAERLMEGTSVAKKTQGTVNEL